MTTMNNAMNTVRKPEYIKMRCTIVNGESWDFLMDVSSLADEAIAPVIDWMVNGTLDERIDTPEIRTYLMDSIDAGAEVLTRFCFDSGEYDHFYALSLIAETEKAGLCCEMCCVELVSLLQQLYVEFLGGSEDAIQEIYQNLFHFFANTAPFVFDVI